MARKPAKVLPFPTRPQAGILVRWCASVGQWVVEISSPSPACQNARHWQSECEALAYAAGVCAATGFELVEGAPKLEGVG